MGTRRSVGGAWGWALLTALTLQGCAEASARTPLVDSRESAEALAEAVLEALNHEDKAALQGFLLSREEYEDHLWPEMPDGEYTPFDFVWSLASANNVKGLGQLLAEYGGMHLEVVSITFTEEPEVYDSFTLHLGAEVLVRNPETGDEGVLPSFDVFVEYGAGWKLMNFDEL